MTLLQLIFAIAILGLIWYLLTTIVPMPSQARVVINVIFVIILIAILLQLLGIGDFDIRWRR